MADELLGVEVRRTPEEVVEGSSMWDSGGVCLCALERVGGISDQATDPGAPEVAGATSGAASG